MLTLPFPDPSGIDPQNSVKKVQFVSGNTPVSGTSIRNLVFEHIFNAKIIDITGLPLPLTLESTSDPSVISMSFLVACT
jgi:hypothetical protein